MEKKLAISKGEDDYYMGKRVFTNLHKVSGTDSLQLNSTKPPEPGASQQITITSRTRVLKPTAATFPATTNPCRNSC